MKTYYSLLDPLRFFAAFWVMNFHYLFGLGLSPDLSWYRYGNLGVQLFFIISGFVITQSLSKSSIKAFAINRFIRLFPLFWIACTFTYILTLLVPYNHVVHFYEYLTSMSMLGDVIGEFAGHLALVDPSYWTLTIELLFYVGIALFCLVFSFEKIRYFLSGWLVFAIASFALHIDQRAIIKILLARHAAYFIFGSALALLAMRHARSRYEQCIDLTLLIASAAYATYIHPLSIPAHQTPNPLDPTIITILHIVFFVGSCALVYFSSYVTHKRTVRILAILGGLTYPLYLLHQTIGNITIDYISNRFNIHRNYVSIPFEVFIIAVAYIVYRWDKRLRDWLKS